MDTFELDTCRVQIGDGVIWILSEEDFNSVNEFCDILNGADGELADAIIEHMPEDYKYLTEECKGEIFAVGSPQLFECAWEFTLKVDANFSSLHIRNIK